MKPLTEYLEFIAATIEAGAAAGASQKEILTQVYCSGSIGAAKIPKGPYFTIRSFAIPGTEQTIVNFDLENSYEEDLTDHEIDAYRAFAKLGTTILGMSDYHIASNSISSSMDRHYGSIETGKLLRRWCKAQASVWVESGMLDDALSRIYVEFSKPAEVALVIRRVAEYGRACNGDWEDLEEHILGTSVLLEERELYEASGAGVEKKGVRL